MLSKRVNKRKVKQDCQNKDDKKVVENDVFCVFQHVAQLLNLRKVVVIIYICFRRLPREKGEYE